MPVEDVISWMKGLGSSSRNKDSDHIFESSLAVPLSSESSEEKASRLAPTKLLPLDSGIAVACAYLNHRVCAGETSSSLHNELANLLLSGLENAITSEDSKRESIYRERLHTFLVTSKNYEPEKIFSWLPTSFLYERALLFARLENHYAVLNVYAVDLRDDMLAENYCGCVWRKAAHNRDMLLLAQHNNPEDNESRVPVRGAFDIYLMLAQCYASRPSRQNRQSGAGNAISNEAFDLLHRYLERIHPVQALKALPTDMPLPCCKDLARALIRSSERAHRASLVEHNLLRVEFVNLKFELTQQQIKQQSTMSTVPEVARLGPVLSSLPPVVLSEHTEDAEFYHVACTRHMFESHVVLQFHVTNTVKGHQMQNIRVRVESLGDADFYAHDAEVSLEILPFDSTGSCYVILLAHPTIGSSITTLFACELRFSVVMDGRDSNTTGAYLEEIPLQNLELPTTTVG